MGDQEHSAREQDPEDQLPNLVQKLRQRLKDSKRCSDKTRIDDDQFLNMFIRVKGYDLDRALEAAEKYYRHFEAFPDLMTDIRSSAGYKDVYDSLIFVLLKTRSCKPPDTTVALLTMANWDTEAAPYRISRQSNVFQMQELIQDKATQLAGFSMIVDFKDLSWSHIKQVGPRDMKYFIRTYQDGIPLRISAIHLVNYPSLMWALWYIATPFMKDKLRSRIHFHKTCESLHEWVDKEKLPKALGGPLELEEAFDQRIEKKLVQQDLKYADYYS